MKWWIFVCRLRPLVICEHLMRLGSLMYRFNVCASGITWRGERIRCISRGRTKKPSRHIPGSCPSSSCPEGNEAATKVTRCVLVCKTTHQVLGNPWKGTLCVVPRRAERGGRPSGHVAEPAFGGAEWNGDLPNRTLPEARLLAQKIRSSLTGVCQRYPEIV